MKKPYIYSSSKVYPPPKKKQKRKRKRQNQNRALWNNQQANKKHRNKQIKETHSDNKCMCHIAYSAWDLDDPYPIWNVDHPSSICNDGRWIIRIPYARWIITIPHGMWVILSPYGIWAIHIPQGGLILHLPYEHAHNTRSSGANVDEDSSILDSSMRRVRLWHSRGPNLSKNGKELATHGVSTKFKKTWKQ